MQERGVCEYLKRYAKDIGVSERFELLGYRSDVAMLLKAADIFVLPSKREGLNVSAMEAMAAGCPCLAGNIRGNVDLIDEGKGGYLFEPHDVSSVKTALENALSMMETAPESFAKLGTYNKEKIKLFSIEEVSKQMEEIFKSISA